MSTGKNAIHVGVLIAHSPFAEIGDLKQFVNNLTAGAQPVLEKATGVNWNYHLEEPVRISNDDSRYPSDFLDFTSLRMVEGPYDAMVVVTDVPLVSRRLRVVPGLASSISRIIVISTKKFSLSPRGEELRPLSSDSVKNNSTYLLLHLTGHLFDLPHSYNTDAIMAPYHFDVKRPEQFHFSRKNKVLLQKKALRFPDRTELKTGFFSSFIFHLKSAFRHPKNVLSAVWRSKAPLIPFSLPRLSTAAITPTLILMFSAEIWDVALHLNDSTVWIAASISIIIAAWYMMISLNLFFPRREREMLTEHAAVVNVSVFLTLLFAMTGLFLLIFLFMFGLEYLIFPTDLMKEWPSLDNPVITFADTVRLAAFISMLGVITGALAGGLESRSVVREFALFRESP